MANFSHTLRNTAVGLGLLLLLGLANQHFGWFRMPWSRPQIFELVPGDCALVLSARSPRAFVDSIEVLPYIGSLRSIGLLDAYLRDLVELDSLFARAGSDVWAQGRCRVLSGLLPHGADDFCWVHLIEQTDGAGVAQLAKAGPDTRLREYSFRKRTVYELRQDDQLLFALAEFRGIVMISRQSQFVERALSQGIDLRPGFRSQSGFRGAWERTGKGQLTLFAQFGRMAQSMSVFCPPDRRDVGSLGSAFSWMGLDLQFSSAGIACQGVASSAGGWLTARLLKAPLEEETKMAEILPDNLAVWLYAALPGSVHEKGSEAFLAHVKPWLGNERAYVLTEPGSADIASYAFVVAKAADKTAALEQLGAAAGRFGGEPPVRHINYQIQRVLARDLLQGMLPEVLSLVENPYYTVVGDYVVFGNSLEGLRWWIDKYNFQLTLSRSERYLRLRAQLAGRGQGFWYFAPEHAYHLLKRYFKPEMEPSFERGYPVASQLGPMAFVLNGQSRRFALQGHVLHSAQRSMGSSISWRVSLNSPAAVSPQAFRTAKSGRVDIFVQDNDKRLYCIAADGSVRWSRVLDSRMFPGLHPTDYYGNGDQQYYLNTQKFIYLLDSLGNDVFPPLEVPAEACSGLLLDKKGEQGRLFLGCSNGQVYGYYPNGGALEGWSPFPDAGELSVPPVSLAKDGKWYVALLSKQGKLTMAERNGKKRFAKELGPEFSAFLGADAEIGRLVVANAAGAVEAFNLLGESFRLTPKVGKNEGVRFIFADVAGDKRKDYVLLSQQHLAVHGYKDKTFQSFQQVKFPKTQTSVFTVVPPEGGKSLIGTVNVPQKEVTLLDSRFAPFPGFPLPGTTRFTLVDLFGDKGMVLVVAEGATVYAYKLR
jgi:hypothetical protein